MSFRKFKSDFYCVGGRHRSATKNLYRGLTSKVSKVVIGYCSICYRKKSITVSDNTIQVEGLGDIFKFLGKKGLYVSKKMAKNVLKNPRWALEIGANIGTVFASRSPKAASSTLPELIDFYHIGKGMYLGKFVLFILCKWKKKQTNCTHQHQSKIKIMI